MLVLILLALAAAIGWAAWCALVATVAVGGALKLAGLDDFEDAGTVEIRGELRFED